MGTVEVFIMGFGVILAAVGIVSILWLQIGGDQQNVIKAGWPPFQFEFRLPQSTLIFVVGVIVLVLPFVIPQYVGQPVAPSVPESSITQVTEVVQPLISSASTHTVAHESTESVLTHTRQLELVVSPELANNHLAVDDYVYVTLRDLKGFVITGATVYLEIADGPNAGLRLSVETDGNGQGVFTYTSKMEGTDTIYVWTGSDSRSDAPKGASGKLSKTWF